MVNDVHLGIAGSGAGNPPMPGSPSGPPSRSDPSGDHLPGDRQGSFDEDGDGDEDDSGENDVSSDSTSASAPLHLQHSRPPTSARVDSDQTKIELLDSRKRRRVPTSVSETSLSSDNGGGNACGDGRTERVMTAASAAALHSHSMTFRSAKEVEDEQLTTVEGQLRRNPHMSEEEARIAAKREYNRRNAARARSRNKSLTQDLQQKVSKLSRHTEELQRTNDILRAQLDLLRQQNETLMAEAAAASSQHVAPEAAAPQQAFPPQPAALLAPSVPAAPLQAAAIQAPPAIQAQSLLSAVGLFSQLLQLQSLMNQAQQQQPQAIQPPPVPQQEPVAPPQVPMTPSVGSGVASTQGATVTPSPNSRSFNGPASAIAHSLLQSGGTLQTFSKGTDVSGDQQPGDEEPSRCTARTTGDDTMLPTNT